MVVELQTEKPISREDAIAVVDSLLDTAWDVSTECRNDYAINAVFVVRDEN
jgi:hypothetical protein